jgi:hypothetical protein
MVKLSKVRETISMLPEPVDNQIPAIIHLHAELGSYQVTFTVKKDGGGSIRTEKVVKVASSSDARKLIEAEYGRERVRITSVRKLPKD